MDEQGAERRDFLKRMSALVVAGAASARAGLARAGERQGGQG